MLTRTQHTLAVLIALAIVWGTALIVLRFANYEDGAGLKLFIYSTIIPTLMLIAQWWRGWQGQY